MKKTGPLFLLFLLLLGTFYLPVPLSGQPADNADFDSTLLSGLTYRMAGPFRGGRSTAVCGLPDQPHAFLMGTTGGGVWKTDDAGHSWHNISDGFFGGSIGAVAVADADPNVIYVGTGSADPRGNISVGHGVWKSTDRGKSWTFAGLPEAGQIGKIRVHPQDPDLVYVAALGHIFGPNPERGVYRSKDGGATWEAVLQVSDSTGAISLVMNPGNPRELYAGMWRAERKPWTMISGSDDGGIFKTTDGGDTWQKLGGGLPTGLTGKIGLTVSPADPDRVWAMIEAEPAGGVYRSDDAGSTWKRVNSENKLRQRAWYYTHMIADPKDPNTVYALNTNLFRSVDGGKTYENIPVPHGDVHDLWINPEHPEVMVVADDGGAQVTLNGGKTWSTYHNQPTAELYGVVVDNGFPYRLYGAQQDNTTISVPGWTSNNTLHAKQHWFSVGGCETGPVALDPNNPDIIYAGCYGGVMDKYDRSTDQVVNIMTYPQLQAGEAAKNLKYRFQWVSPMAVSPHDPREIYHGSQYVHRSRDAGQTWEVISPDLSTNTPEHLEYSGGPINNDITGVEIYNVVFEIVVDPYDKGTLWAGTDDGRLHITRDDGASWQEITPPGLPEYATVNKIELSPHQAGRALVAVQKYRFDDFAPYIFLTNDHGKSWTRIGSGIPDDHPVRVVREDPVRKGLLYAGTEFGLFVSFDEGENWKSMQGNLPITPITDMRIVQNDLVMSTQGRSFWILDDITPLQQMQEELASQPVHFFEPRPAYKVNDGGAGELSDNAPEGRPGGALFHYALRDSMEGELRLEIYDQDARVVRVFSSDSTEAKAHKTEILEPAEGLNRVIWDLTYEGPTFQDSAIIWGYTGGVKAPPGSYYVRLSVGDETVSQQVDVLEDPRIAGDISQEDYEAQLSLGLEIRDAITEVHEIIGEIRSVKEQVAWMRTRSEDDELTARADSVLQELSMWEDQLMQTRNRSGQDVLRFPPRLDNQMVENYGYVTGMDSYISGGREGRPNEAAYTRWSDLEAEWAELKTQVENALDREVERFNEMVEAKNIIGVQRKEMKP